jgi:hypothetical protein
MTASKGFNREDDSIRAKLVSKGEVAPMHIVVLPIDRKFIFMKAYSYIH